jgi:hypothetical protein
LEFNLSIASPSFRLIFWGNFRHYFNALHVSESNLANAKHAYFQACDASQKFCIAEENFLKNTDPTFLDCQVERWNLRFTMFSESEQKTDGELKELIRLARIVKESVDKMNQAKLIFEQTCRDALMEGTKSKILT